MITKYMKRKIQDKMVGNVDYSIPTYYIGLSKTAPTVDGTNDTPPVGNGYARVAVTNNKTNWTNSDDDGVIKNSVRITYAESTGVWSTEASPITHFTIYDALTGGNMLFGGALTNPRAIAIDMQLFIEVNGIVFDLDDKE